MKKIENKEQVPNTKSELELIQQQISEASAEINLILVKNKLEFVVVHRLIVNQELKQEEIGHDMVIRPIRK